MAAKLEVKQRKIEKNNLINNLSKIWSWVDSEGSPLANAMIFFSYILRTALLWYIVGAMQILKYQCEDAHLSSISLLPCHALWFSYLSELWEKHSWLT